VIYIFYVYKVYIGVRSKKEISLRFISPSTLSVLFGFGMEKHRGKVMSHRANKLHMPYLTISI